MTVYLNKDASCLRDWLFQGIKSFTLKSSVNFIGNPFFFKEPETFARFCCRAIENRCIEEPTKLS